MNEQPTFAGLDYQHKRRWRRREEFLERMDSLVPWQRLEERIRPHYFRAERGRRPYPLPVMLRVHIVQLCYNLSDPAMEDLLYQAGSVRRFAGLGLSEPIPDESTILHFRHLSERHQLGSGMFVPANQSAPEAVGPAMGVFRHPAERSEGGSLFDGPGFLVPVPYVAGETELLQYRPELV